MSGLAVVTGASRGIGRAVALAFAQRGMDVALLARDEAALSAVGEICRAQGVRVGTYCCDVGDPEAVARATMAILQRQGTPDVVVNNAGVVHRALLQDTSVEQWRQVIGVNLDGVFYVTRGLLAAMLQEGRGRIVNIASISSTLGTARQISYCASKWGVVGFTKALAEELRGTGLQTLSVLPGSTDTDMLVGSGFAPQMSPEDVARVVLYAALEAPPAMNGSSLDVFGP